jgi:hypothetical protein
MPEGIAMRYTVEPLRGRLVIVPLIVVVLALLVVGCTVRLAPNYEQPIVDGLNHFNVAIQTHLAVVSEGTKKGLTEEQQKVYDGLKAQGKALIMLIEARPQPKSGFARWFGTSRADDISKDGNIEKITFLDVPTDDQIKMILEQLSKMEEEDRRQGLQPGQYKLYANPINSFMRNALTYELALKR